MKNNKKGFTLIELLVVIAIIGLLSTLAVVALNNARAKARDARRLSDIKQIQTALELYYSEIGQYPAAPALNGCFPSSPANEIAGCCLSGGGFAQTCTAGTAYMSEVPANPTPLDGCVGVMEEYTYTQDGADGASYTLQYCIGQDNGNITGGIANSGTPAGIVNN